MRLYKTQYSFRISGNRGYDSNRVRFPSTNVNVDQQLFGYPRSSKYLILCSAQKRN